MESLPLLAALALYLLVADYEGAAEIYSVATKKDQAKKTLTEAVNMVKQSPELRAVLKKRRNDIYFPATPSIFEALASDSNTLDGLNSHAVIIDELHAIRDRNLYEVMKQSTSSRRQPLVIMITTSGTVRESVFDNLYGYACEVADGKTIDERFLPVLYELDERAKKNPEDLPGVLCKDFNVPEVAATVWLSFEDIKSDAVFSMADVYNTYAIGGCDISATRVSTAQPRHVRQDAEMTVSVNDYLDRVLQFRPNPYMTASEFYYKLAAIYPINAQYFELLEYMGVLYCRFRFATRSSYICEYSRLIHIRRHFLENDIFGDSNKPLETVLKTANTFNQSMSKFAELIAVIRGVLKVSNAVKTEDLNKRRDDFIRDNLRMENNGAGVIVTDAKYKYTPISDKTTPIPSTQLSYVKEESCVDGIGVSKEIVENTATPAQESAFYSGEIAPFFRKLTQAFTNCLFTEREVGHGNRIVFSSNSIQFATLTGKVSAAKFLTEIGAATLDQILTMFDMPTIGGEEGARRVQTLNMVNAELADKYQTGKNGPDKDPPPEPPDPPDGDGPEDEKPPEDGGEEGK